MRTPRALDDAAFGLAAAFAMAVSAELIVPSDGLGRLIFLGWQQSWFRHFASANYVQSAIAADE